MGAWVAARGAAAGDKDMAGDKDGAMNGAAERTGTAKAGTPSWGADSTRSTTTRAWPAAACPGNRRVRATKDALVTDGV